MKVIMAAWPWLEPSDLCHPFFLFPLRPLTGMEYRRRQSTMQVIMAGWQPLPYLWSLSPSPYLLPPLALYCLIASLADLFFD